MNLELIDRLRPLPTLYHTFYTYWRDAYISKDLRIRRYIRIFPWQFQDSPYKFNLGKNYVIIGSWKKDMKYPLLERIYDFKGHYIGRLNFKDDPKNELVDIVGDRLVAFNPATSTISVYQIQVK